MEKLTVREHQVVFRLQGRAWKPADAYRWIGYEAQDPLGQLLLAGERLEREWMVLLARATPDVMAAWQEFGREEEAAVVAAQRFEAELTGTLPDSGGQG